MVEVVDELGAAGLKLPDRSAQRSAFGSNEAACTDASRAAEQQAQDARHAETMDLLRQLKARLETLEGAKASPESRPEG